VQLGVGGEGRNRPCFPAVAPQICLILLAIQAKSVLSDYIFFNPFGVRFGVRFADSRFMRLRFITAINGDSLALWLKIRSAKNAVGRKKPRFENPSF
jgi:hypothetical protein